VRAAAAAGVDALIVQDPAVALLARAVCPALELHASTQMTLSAPAAAAVRDPPGRPRIVVPRELSVEEIAAFAAASARSSSRCSSTARCACRGAASA
jgi:putative protease